MPRKDKDAGPVRHKVLYVNGHPVMSREVDDPNADEDIGAYRLEAVNNARNAGAIRPEFEVKLEEGGKEVQGA